MAASFEIPRSLLAEGTGRDLRIDGTMRMVVGGAKAHGTRPDRSVARARILGVNLVLRGRGRYVDAAGREHELRPGILFHRYPGPTHSTWFDPESDYAECFVVFDAGTGAGLLRAGLLSSTPVHDVGVDAVILDELRHLMKVIRTPELQLPSRQALLAAISFIEGLYDRARRNRALGRWPKAIEDACLLLEHNADERLRVESIARRVGVSYAAFRKRFVAATGYSPADYRIRRRLESAQRLLMGATVAQAARTLGYPDPFAFSAQFRRFVGMSPRAFQRRLRDGGHVVPLVEARAAPQ